MTDESFCNARLLREDVEEDLRALDEMRADPRVEIFDRFTQQHAELLRRSPAPDPDLLTEPKRWVYYPWRRSLVSMLGPRGFVTLRLDRNRHLITSEEQSRLRALRIGVVGLSAGHAVAYTLAAEGVCGTLRLADFDELELSNLNRVPATIFDVGLNKATVAARRIAELDPYVNVETFPTGLTTETVDDFLDGLDIVVEECDSLDVKVMLREQARARRVPVLMATSDRGLVDVERFDLEPQRPILHGMLGDVDSRALRGLTTQDKIPYVLRILDARQQSPRVAASLLEVGRTLAGWPQRAGDIWVGAAALTEAVRRIGLGEHIRSGRTAIDIAAALDRLDQPSPPPQLDRSFDDAAGADEHTEPATIADIVAAAAVRAPSGGNTQPWHVLTQEDSVTISLAPEHTSTLDLHLRASAVALGAATFNARVAAAAHGALGPVSFDETGTHSPLQATLRFADGDEPAYGALYQPMLARETNRHRGTSVPIDADTVAALTSAATAEGTHLHLLLSPIEIEGIAAILAAADRIRYLTPHLHREMIAELRWPGDSSPDSGIDVFGLELDPGKLSVLNLLRRADVMALLAKWSAGTALGDYITERVCASSGVAIVCVDGNTLTDYARGGAGAEAVWIAAQRHGLAVHPVSPVFLYARDRADFDTLSPSFASSLHSLQQDLRRIAGIGTHEHEVLMFRLFDAPPPSVRSRRRSLQGAARVH